MVGDEARAARGCPDCGAAPGTVHSGGCDVARCLVTGRQRLTCDPRAAHPGADADCGQDVWAGEWPGTAECGEYGLWVTGSPFVPCGPGDPGALTDLNTLTSCGIWSMRQGRWVMPGHPVGRA